MVDWIGIRLLASSVALSGILLTTGFGALPASAQTESDARTRGFQASNIGEDIRRDVGQIANEEIGRFHVMCGGATAGAKGTIAFAAIEKHAPQLSETTRVLVNGRISAGLRETMLLPAEMSGLKHLVPFLRNDEQGRKQLEEAERRIQESPVLVTAEVRRPGQNLLHLQLTFNDRRPGCPMPRQRDLMFNLADLKTHNQLPLTDGDYYELSGLFHKGLEQAEAVLRSAKQVSLAVDLGIVGRCTFKDRVQRLFEVQYQNLRSEISSRIGRSPLPPLPARSAAPLPPADGGAEIRLSFQMSRASSQVIAGSVELIADGRQEAAVYGDAVIDADWLKGCSPAPEPGVGAQALRTPEKEPAQATPPEPPRAFKDCDDCPEMIEVPSGTYTMGSDAGEVKEAAADEGPVTTVTLKSFAASRTEISVAEFERFLSATGYQPAAMNTDDRSGWCAETQGNRAVRASGRNHRAPGFDQGPSHPVVCVSWHDAKAFVAWLSTKAGTQYRLLSEAEFEYAQRAGTKTPFWWGSSADPARAQYEIGQGSYSQGWRGTIPAEQLSPNSWGFLNISGNAAEWVEDCWHARHPSQPTDGAARISADCSNRVIRGGGWTYSATMLRSSARDNARAGAAYVDVGFRVARDGRR